MECDKTNASIKVNIIIIIIYTITILGIYLE